MRNKILFFLITCFLFSSNISFGQCPAPVYTLPDTVCPNKPITITNSSNAISFNWDNGLGDLDSIPTVSAVSNISGLNYPNCIKVICYQGNYYSFITNFGSNYITRLDFGNSLNNTPTVVQLPSNSLLSNGVQSINAVQENNKWLLFVVLSNPNSLVRIELDSINQNNNLIYTNFSISGMNGSNSLKLMNHFGVMANVSDDKLVVIDFNGSYLNSPITSNLISTGIPSNNSLDLIFDWSNCSYYAFLGSYAWGTVTKVDFGNSLNNAPNKSIILTGLYTSTGIKTTKENGEWNLLLAYNNGIGNYKIGSNPNNLPNLNYFLNGNGLLPSPSNIELIKDQNEWIVITANYYQWNVIQLKFPSANAVNNISSNLSSPNNFQFSPDLLGWQPIEYIEEFENGITNTYLDSIYVNISPPEADFKLSTSCVNDSISFTDQSFICFGNIVNWTWTFGDGGTSNFQDPKHSYNIPGVYNVSLEITDDFNQTSVINKTVNVYQKPKANFTFIDNSCSGAPVLFTDSSTSADGVINNWNWSINNVTSSINNTSNIFTASGSYQATLIVSSEFGCIDSIQKNITIQPSPIADFSASNTCVNEVAAFTNLTDSNSISNVTYEWTIGGFLGTNNPNPSYQFPATDGIYGIVLIANSPNGCADTIIKSVLIGNRPNPDFTLSSDTVCQNSIFTINDNSTPGFFNTINNRTWNMGNGVIINDSLIFNYAYSTPGIYQIQLSLLSPTNCDSSITKNIVVVASPNSNYTVSDACLGATTQFTDISTSPVGTFINSWQLNYGDNTQTTNPNSTHLYSIDGNFTTSLIVTSNIGCSDTTSITALVHPLPTANFIIGKSCTGNETMFTDSTTISSGTINNWSWNFGNNLGISNQQNSSFIFQNNFAYPVQLISSSSFGCLDTITKYVVVDKTPDVSVITTDNCEGLFSQLNYTLLSSASTNLAFLWNFGDSTSSFQPSPSHLYGSIGTYTITLEVTDLTNGCAVTKNDSLTINPNPKAEFNYSDACIGKELFLTENSTIATGSIDNFTWNINSVETLFGSSVSYTSNQTGILNTTLITTSDFGCEDSITKSITIYPNPNVAFTSDVIYGAPPLTINFDNTSSAGVYTWDFDDGSSISSLANPSHVFNDTGTYQVELYVTSQYGCIDSAQLVINVFEPIVDISVINNSITRQGNQWVMKALFKNNGNLTINDVDVKLNLQGKSVLYERITSLNLLPGSFIEYKFKSSFDANDVTPSYFCVEATSVDNFSDRNSENNTFCSTIKNEFECYNLYPNPASDYISFGLTIPEDGLVEVNLYNETGRDCIQMKSEYYAKGYSNIILNFNQATMISSASYIIKVRYKESFRTLKFIKH